VFTTRSRRPVEPRNLSRSFDRCLEIFHAGPCALAEVGAAPTPGVSVLRP
jgi:hypothetical protein